MGKLFGKFAPRGMQTARAGGLLNELQAASVKILLLHFESSHFRVSIAVAKELAVLLASLADWGVHVAGNRQ